ncbi:MAG: NUDIX domain-containing protein [Parvularculaceae bacterium]
MFVETPIPAAKPEIKARIGELWPQSAPAISHRRVDVTRSVFARRALPIAMNVRCRNGAKAFARGDQESFPKRAAKAAKPTRFGEAYALFNGKAKCCSAPPGKGLLGGMLGLPGTEWSVKKPDPAPPAKAKWRAAGAVRHTFTHFHLELDVFAAPAPKAFRA